MYVITCEAALSPESKVVIRKEFRERTGQDCIILDCGMKVQLLPTKGTALCEKAVPLDG